MGRRGFHKNFKELLTIKEKTDNFDYIADESWQNGSHREGGEKHCSIIREAVTWEHTAKIHKGIQRTAFKNSKWFVSLKSRIWKLQMRTSTPVSIKRLDLALIQGMTNAPHSVCNWQENKTRMKTHQASCIYWLPTYMSPPSEPWRWMRSNHWL